MSAYRVRSISVVQAPGMTNPPRAIRPGTGVNLLVGTNGAGKSTLARAARTALWGGETWPGFARVEFETPDGDVVPVNVSPRTPAPPRGPRVAVSRANVCLSELVRSDGHEEIGKALANAQLGFDPTTAREAFSNARGAPREESEYRKAKAERDRLRVERERDFKEAERDLKDAEAALAALPDFAAEARALDVREAFYVAERDARAAREAVDAFPNADGRTQAGDDAKLDRLEEELQEAESDAGAPRREAEGRAAHARRLSPGEGMTPPDDAWFTETRVLLRRYEDAEKAVGHAAEAVREANGQAIAELRQAADLHPRPGEDVSALARRVAGAFPRLAADAERWARAVAARTALDDLERHVPPLPPRREVPADAPTERPPKPVPSSPEFGGHLDYLAQPDGGGAGVRSADGARTKIRLAAGAAVLAALFAGGAFALGAVALPVLSVGAAGLAVVAGVASAVLGGRALSDLSETGAAARVRPPDGVPDDRQAVKGDLARRLKESAEGNARAAADWAEATLRFERVESDRRWNEDVTRAERAHPDWIADLRRERKEDLDLADGIESARREWIEAEGLAPDASAPYLGALVRALEELRKTETRLEKERNRFDDAARALDAARAAVDAAFAPYPHPAGASAGERQRQFDGLKGWRDAQEAAGRAEVARAAAENRLQTVTNALEMHFVQCGFAPGEGAALRAAARSAQARDAAVAALNAAVAVRDRALAPLGEAPEDAPGDLDAAILAIQAARGVLTERAAEKAGLEKVRNDAHDLWRGLKDALPLEKAEAKCDEAYRDLLEVRNARDLAVAGRALVGWLEEEMAARRQPESLRGANETLARVAPGLSLFAPGGEIRARHDGEEKTLAELSDGTRVQALLAARLGSLRADERGELTPLFLDETFANWDAPRTRAGVDLLLEEAQAGRQVFYLTNQPEEVSLWRERAEALGLEPPTVHEVRPGWDDGFVPARGGEYLRPMDVGAGFAAYVDALGLPPFDPWREPMEIALHHVCQEGELLHLEAVRQEQRARVEHLLGAPGHWTEERLRWARAMEARAEILRATCAVWRQGRPRPLRARDLIEWCERNGVGGGIPPRLCALLEQNDHDAVRFAAAFPNAATGMRDAKKPELADWLRESGYVTDAPPVPRETLRETALQTAERHVREQRLTDADVRLILSLLPD